jgi:hypothetical protein
MDRVTTRIPADPHRDGDGRVPLASATLPGVEIRHVEGEHGRLPTIPAVYQDVFRFPRGKPMKLPRAAAEALDHSHLADAAEDTATPALSVGAIASRGEDPGAPRNPRSARRPVAAGYAAAVAAHMAVKAAASPASQLSMSDGLVAASSRWT